ncbi:MAG: 4a-hydroxytetrahydrobiopterin dehydratase [Meiothermus sp.]
MSALTQAEIQQALSALPGWALVEGRIEKSYRFAAYADGAAFAFRITLLAEKTDHHPDTLTIAWKEVRVAYVTHSQGGVTKKDLEAARALDELYTRFNA